VLKTQTSLLGIVFAAAFIGIVLMPGLWYPLRIDLLLGMVIGVIIHLGFSQGLVFVLVASLSLQAFSGARPGLIPLFYLVAFIMIDVLKDVIYLENITTQILLTIILSALAACGLIVFLDIRPSPLEIIPLAVCCVLSGCASPLMVDLVGRIKRGYET
jgi:hypothetical protein